MRDKIINFNNNAAIVFVVLFPLLAAWLAGPGGIIVQGIAVVLGFIVAAVITGLWFVLVGIYDELKFANMSKRTELTCAKVEVSHKHNNTRPPAAGNWGQEAPTRTGPPQ